MKVILNSFDYERRNEQLSYKPDEAVVLSGAQELDRMTAERIRGGKFSS